ncbi:MAG: tRNA (guanosine(18)-2'-O)-methyltransferase TrmH [Chromatiales bacterium 21-64-14]|nr:MAG: tRNA (guanosine(18)-2'-O)-methyltransferase TrmH [Chromatiales bacterium 21-64-14]HQU15854.1 tRNA (guanosine(18)-2'-O)-methyltransferase TrmH [Gammaproteobacteria bacterium]
MTPERYERLRAVLDRRQPDLTVLLDRVHKPHNLSAVLRTCDAVGIWEAHGVHAGGGITAHDATSASSGKWVRLRIHSSLADAYAVLRTQGVQVLAAHLSGRARDFRTVDYTAPTAIVLGAEKYGVSPEGAEHADAHIVIPMLGMVPSLNVSVAAAVILFEAQRQRAAAGLYDTPRLDPGLYARTLFEWGYPEIAEHCRQRGAEYPPLGADGAILGPLPR